MTLVSATFKVDGSGWLWGPALDGATHDPEWGLFNVVVPEGVWQTYLEATDALDLAREQVMVASRLAPHAPHWLVACGSFRQDKPDPQRFMAESLSRRCQVCGHFADAHEARQAVA